VTLFHVQRPVRVSTGAAVCVAFAIILGAAYLTKLGGLTNVFFPPGSVYSDLMLSHWPNAWFFQESVRSNRVWPLWNPLQFAGVPFAANPLTGLWYPPNWLLAALPLAPGFNLLLLAHLVLSGVGMVRLLQRLGLDAGSAGAGAVAWALTPRVIGHLGAGHVGMVYAVAWIPWLADAAWRIADQSKARDRSARAVVRLAAVAALQFLADPRIFAYCLAGLLMMALWRCMAPGRVVGKHADCSGMGLVGLGWRAIRPWFGALTLAAALSAVQWIPLAEYLPLTGRADLTSAETAFGSLPASHLMGMLWADRGGFHEWNTYVGVVVLALAVVGLTALPRRHRLALLVALSAVVLYALGQNTPLHRWVAQIPGADLMRVPARSWFLVAFAVSVLAGAGASQVGRLTGSRLRHLNRAAAGAAGLLGALALGAQCIKSELSGVAWLAVLWLALAVGSCSGVRRWRIRAPYAGMLFSLIILAELAWVDETLVEPRAVSNVLEEDSVTAAWLANQAGRVYAPSFRPSPAVAMEAGLGLVSGVDPLQPTGYARFLESAGGVERMGYGVTLPAIPDGEPVGSALEGAELDGWLLSVLDVGHVVTGFPFDQVGFQLVFEDPAEGLAVHRNMSTVPWPVVFGRVEAVQDMESAIAWLAREGADRAAVVIGGQPLGGVGYRPAQMVTRKPNRLAVEAVGPGLLVVSEVHLPGWKATVDGQSTPVVLVDGVLRGVYLEPGDHAVEMIYRPVPVLAGLAVTASGLMVALFTWFCVGRRK